MRDAVEKNYKSVIILESDVFLRNDFVERLHQILEDVKINNKIWGYISLSEGVGSRPNNVDRSYFVPTKTYDPPHNCVYRCTDSMMFSLEYLKKLAPTLIPFNEPTDWELNYQNMLHQGKALWADPPLAEQGTCYSREITSLPS
jgi:GR25 family glycosyltransferase involved in LPS biosynthesis